MFRYDLTLQRNGVKVASSADGDSDESVSVANPTAGTYDVIIDGYSVPAGTTSYDYRDVFYASALGTLDAAATTATLGTGATASLTGSVTAQSAPAAGRRLFGELLVVTDQGAVVGRGNVSIGTVN
ncbi:hypothetical protein [Micromonospora fulviviridis]|uniref:hypothetical protein n=1 Tax=Micromonospora fulviviridis TaxID=47860 RepID=UPI00379B1026